jgi:hypothetical protein
MTERGDPRSSAESNVYYYRRPLGVGEILPAVAVGVAAGLVAFYVTSIIRQRTPLRPVTSRIPGQPVGPGRRKSG